MNRRITGTLRPAGHGRSGLAAAALAGFLFVAPLIASAADEPKAGTATADEAAQSADEATQSADEAGESANPASTAVDAAAPPANDLNYTRETYYYAATGLRDPFGSLVSGRFVSEDSKRLPDIGSISLLGVMWGENDKFALVEDQEMNGFVLRVGDPVVNGEVAGITRESLSIRQHFFGSSTTVTLKLKPREDKGHASKNKR